MSMIPSKHCLGPIAHPVEPPIRLERASSADSVPAIFTAREKIDAWHKAWNKEDTWCPLTPEELDALGDEAADDLNKYQEKLMDEEPSVGNLEKATKGSFECYKCSAASKCPFVYDPYNTKGTDCLASK